ncbi:hypothetical protein Ddye_010386 [Dipteronia dyeriana]|uniref:Uncharacterized protein n=1 Tax=Dipteronia dyeriana TaxID=168575 RepID=A0AAD9XD73_9ROSI|nr:hypothetical protein Ddye_010386 [Dipteronia dyeriana]
MGCFLCCHLFVDIGSHKLENEHADFALSTLYILQSSLNAVQLFKRRGWKMDCFHCSCTKTFLPATFPRLAGDAWIIDSSSSRGSRFLCTHLEGQLGWCRDLSSYRLLPTSRARPSIWRIQKFVHPKPWNIEHSRHNPSVSLSCLGSGTSLHVGTIVIVWSCEFSLLCNLNRIFHFKHMHVRFRILLSDNLGLFNKL